MNPRSVSKTDSPSKAKNDYKLRIILFFVVGKVIRNKMKLSQLRKNRMQNPWTSKPTRLENLNPKNSWNNNETKSPSYSSFMVNLTSGLNLINLLGA